MREEKPVVIFPGDWIEYIVTDDGRHETRVGMVLEISEDLGLKVSTGARDNWTPSEKWYATHVNLDRVIRRFPRFAVLPIPGKLEEKEE